MVDFATSLLANPYVHAVVSGLVLAAIVRLAGLRSYDAWRDDLLREEPHFRELAAKQLATKGWGTLYASLLDRALRRADGFFGPALSQGAFATCVVLGQIGVVVAALHAVFGLSLWKDLGEAVAATALAGSSLANAWF
ncbi:MAG: hypothetical protein AAFX81_01570 [Pseudomonadota bacterium]